MIHIASIDNLAKRITDEITSTGEELTSTFIEGHSLLRRSPPLLQLDDRAVADNSPDDHGTSPSHWLLEGST